MLTYFRLAILASLIFIYDKTGNKMAYRNKTG